MERTLRARLVAYEPFGKRLAVLPEPISFDASIVHNDDGSLNVTYPTTAVGGDIISRRLEDGLEIAVEVSDGTGYVEPDNARYLAIGRKGDQTDPTGTITISSAPSMSWILSKILNNDTSHLIADGDNKGKRAFLSATPGTILKTILDENKSRGGAATGLTLGFDTTKDSANTKWANIYTLYYSLGVSAQTMLAGLINGGGIDWRTHQRRLDIYNPDSPNLCRDLSNTIRLNPGRDITEAPYEESISDLASDILVSGDEGLTFRMNNPAAPTPWGKWETYVSQGGVSDEGTARAFMQTTLETSARVRGQYTRSLVTDNTTHLPLIDYHPGDWITAPTTGHGEKVRVQEIDISVSNSKLTASIALNDLKYDTQVRQAKKIQGITGGAVLAGSESGRPAPAQDHRVPKAPSGLVVSTDAYVNANGYARGTAMAQWAAVSKAMDKTASEVSSYQVEWRENTAGAPWHAAGVSTGTSLAWSDLDCGVQMSVRVRAMPTYSDQPGLWSTETVVTIASDVTQPSVPSKPVLKSELGVVTIHWDGKTAAGGRMEADFDHVEVGRGTGPNNLTVAATTIDVDDFVDTNLEAGSTWTYGLRAVDHAGNQSDWSQTAQITVASAVSPEEVEQIRKTLEQANKDLDQTRDDLAENTNALNQAQQDIQANQTAISQANKDIQANQTAVEQTRKDVQANKTALDQANKELDQTQAELTQVGKDLTAAEATLSEHDKALEQARQDLDKVEGWDDDIQAAAQKATDAYSKAVTAQTTADGKNRIYRQSEEPQDNPKGTLKPGDLWYRTQTYWTRWQDTADNSASLLADFYTMWQGAADNSPSVLVPLSDRVVEVLMWDGTRWNSYNLVASNVIASGTVTADTLAAGSVLADKIAANAVTSDKIIAGAVTTAKLSALSVNVDKLAANSVTAAKIAAGAVTADKIAANAIVAGKIAANAVTVGTIAAGAVTAEKIAANAVTTAKLNALAVTADKIAAGAVTAEKITAGAINADKLAANAVTSVKIAAGAVNADKLAANSVTTAKLNALAVTADKLAANSVTADKIAANSVTAVKIAAGTITSDKIKAGQFQGYTFTGAIYQSSTSSNTGFKLRNSGLDMWDSNHNKTVHLDGEGQNNLLTGTFSTGITGNRVWISPEFTQEEIHGTDKIEGSGIRFYHKTAADIQPYIASESATQEEGEVSSITINGGHRLADDPGAFGRIGVRKTDSGVPFGTVMLGAYGVYDSDTEKRRAILELYSPKTGTPTYASLSAYSQNTPVGIGVEANISNRYLYLGGALGGFTSCATFQVWHWRMRWGSTPHNYAGNVNVTSGNPAKFGSYVGVASADSDWSGIICHPANTQSASGMTVKFFNADVDCNVDIYCAVLAWLKL